MKTNKSEFKSSYKDIECYKIVLMINWSFSINRRREVINATIQFVPNLGHGIVNLSCNMQGAYMGSGYNGVYDK